MDTTTTEAIMQEEDHITDLQQMEDHNTGQEAHRRRGVWITDHLNMVRHVEALQEVAIAEAAHEAVDVASGNSIYTYSKNPYWDNQWGFFLCFMQSN